MPYARPQKRFPFGNRLILSDIFLHKVSFTIIQFITGESFLGNFYFCPIPKISIGKRAATGWMEKDPENKPRKEKVYPETDP